jgi:hypothetical protein
MSSKFGAMASIKDNTMNQPSDIRPFDANEINRLHELARIQASALRREAIDDFWRGGNALLSDTVHGLRRASERLAARLKRHNTLRAAPRGC